MSDVIKVENLYKQYRLGQVSTGSIAHDLNRWWHTVRGKEDPYQKITGLNNRDQADSSEYVWALQDINFSVKQGEVLGIIGKNGAGKSTLLKILSKVTSPTKGNIKVKGRIASLLEVGTGFHPELTGRENIFLNGAILGMTKAEIRSKFDEIVAFSGVEKYIDTPVKRYSSGMYVRLAFAVAAHLEPEILIVDEVLAVGDAEFQKKCLGKMKDVSGEGRTVLFVSHNMAAVETLCENSILLTNGEINIHSNTSDVLREYYDLNQNKLKFINVSNERTHDQLNLVLKSAEIICVEDKGAIDINTSFQIKFAFVNASIKENFSVSFDLLTFKDEIVFGSGGKFNLSKDKESKLVCQIPKNLLNDNIYKINLYVHDENMNLLFEKMEILTFEIKDTIRINSYLGKINGFIRPNLNWKLINE
jgi:lipopolysaccharide transport system ATP-binding protein